MAIERAFYSLWSKPLDNRKFNMVDFAIWWAASFITNRQWFKEIGLVTDDAGKEFLIDKLQLSFDDVSLSLNDNPYNSHFWASGKILAWKEQIVPSIQLDYDVLFIQPPTAEMLEAPVLCQRKEATSYEGYKIPITQIDRQDFKKPKYWSTDIPIAYNCGVVGFNDMELKDEYIRGSLELLETLNKHKDFTRGNINRKCYDVIFEQYYLSCVMKHRCIKPKTIDVPQPESINDIFCHFFWIFKWKQENIDFAHSIVKAYDLDYYEYILNLKL